MAKIAIIFVLFALFAMAMCDGPATPNPLEDLLKKGADFLKNAQQQYGPEFQKVLNEIAENYKDVSNKVNDYVQNITVPELPSKN